MSQEKIILTKEEFWEYYFRIAFGWGFIIGFFGIIPYMLSVGGRYVVIGSGLSLFLIYFFTYVFLTVSRKHFKQKFINCLECGAPLLERKNPNAKQFCSFRCNSKWTKKGKHKELTKQ
jgi:hypothetical protein